jgi:molybdopterin converting factor small subunit
LVVRVHLHATLQRLTAAGAVRNLEVELPALSTLTDLLGIMELRLDLKATLLVVNGRTGEASQVLEEGDEVHLIPAISGG